jgi:hypothetical protein
MALSAITMIVSFAIWTATIAIFCGQPNNLRRQNPQFSSHLHSFGGLDFYDPDFVYTFVTVLGCGTIILAVTLVHIGQQVNWRLLTRIVSR